VNMSKQNFQFDYCANIASIEALRHVSSPPSDGLKIIAHIAGTSELWLARVSGNEPSLEAWPTIQLIELPFVLTFQRDRWLSLADQYSDSSPIDYMTRSGVGVVNTFAEIGQEVLLHSAHHRGQIALLLRQSAFEPPTSTDYIPMLRKMPISDTIR
jgi:uncharacterized damage-inducible protein DinB